MTAVMQSRPSANGRRGGMTTTSANAIVPDDVALRQKQRAAVAYAIRMGWGVLLTHGIQNGRCTCGRDDCPSPGKHPVTKHGVKDATKDPATIMRLLARYPWANIAIATGKVSGFFVLDVDPDHGGDDSLRDLVMQHGPLPDTVEQLTGGGGRHILFRWPGRPVPNRVAIAPGLDVRGDGGYIVVAPSVHHSGRRYVWELSSRPGEVPIAPAPQWLLDLVLAGADGRRTTPPEEWRRLAAFGVEEGQRNIAIARLAGHLLRRGVDPYLVALLLLGWNESRCRPPLPAEEVLRTVNSIAKREAARRGLLAGGRSA